MRAKLSHKYIKGSGIEIGALHCPTPVVSGTHVTYVDRDPKIVAADHSDVAPKIKEWFVNDANYLESFGILQLDFVIAHHVLEHLENPIRAFIRWVEVLKVGGVLILSLPDKTQCFDRNRETTSFAHLMSDWVTKDQHRRYRDLEHYIDWFMNSELEKKPDAEAIELATKTWLNQKNIHFHVWDKEAMIELFARLESWSEKGLFPKIKALDAAQNGGEFIFVFKRVGE